MSILGDRLKSLRKDNKLTQNELAQELNKKYGLNIDRAMISKWETDFQTPTISTLSCIKDYFNVSLDYINGDSSINELPQNIIDDVLIELLTALSELTDEERAKVSAFIEGLKANR